MKTLYTLLLAFGLCFTVHAQSQAIYTVDQKNNMLSAQEKHALNNLLFESLPMVLFSNNGVFKPFSVENSINKKIVLENQYEITNNMSGYMLSDFQTSEILILQYEEGKTFNIDVALLQNMNNLQYIYLISNNDITVSQVSTILQNILVEVDPNVEVVYQVSKGG